MTPEQFRKARERLGLTVAQMATVLSQSEGHVRHMEVEAGRSSNRPIPDYIAKLVDAMLKGFRTRDWPKEASQ